MSDVLVLLAYEFNAANILHQKAFVKREECFFLNSGEDPQIKKGCPYEQPFLLIKTYVNNSFRNLIGKY